MNRPKRPERNPEPMKLTMASTPDSGLFLIVCRDCLWTPGRTMTEREIDRAENSHRNDCPGTIPATRSKTQFKAARRILTGNY